MPRFVRCAVAALFAVVGAPRQPMWAGSRLGPGGEPH